MVTNVTNLTRSGLADWVIQRVTAVILAAYMLCILGSLLLQPEMSFEHWRALFDSNLMRFFSLIALISLCAHGWIGMWTIATDYLTVRHLGPSATFFRLLFLAVCAVLTVIYLLWGVQIFWGL